MNLKRRRKIATKIHRWLTVEHIRYLFWSKFWRAEKICPHDGIYISSRKDRYGANSVPWLNALALARVTGQTLYHHCSTSCFKYRDSVMHRLLVKNSVASEHCGTCDLHEKAGWFHGQHEVLMQHTEGLPLPDVIAGSALKEEFFNCYRREAAAREWTLQRKSDSLIVIHVRLDDIKDHEKTNKQGFIGEDNLSRLITLLNGRYPDHQIHLVTSPNRRDINLCKSVIEKSNISCSVSGSDNIDYDLYLMMCSDVLILSRSTFCFIAGLLHQGSHVYSYTNWQHFEELIGPYPATGNDRNRSKVLSVLQ
ncbi:MAG: hypothetical protein ACI9BW_001534 [Gammaproteobacteria bacterium]|jgi:hypothetical protein